MPTPRRNESWDSQYQSDFRPRRYPRQVAARPTSPSRRNNPHPVKDFLLYRRHQASAEDEVHSTLRAAILRSAPVLPGGKRDLNAIPVGTLPIGDYQADDLNSPRTDRPSHSAHVVPLSARCHAATARTARQYSTFAGGVPLSETDLTIMAAKKNNREIIMSRGLSPRRAAPSRIPGRTMTHYGSFGNREEPNPYIGGLDLYASPYNANRGFSQGFTDYSCRRQSRPAQRQVEPTPRSSKGEEYLHNNSVYYSTTPNVTGYFIIHPDWVSERTTLRRSQSLLSF